MATLSKTVRGRLNGESGQAMVGFAIMIMAIMGMLAIVIDLGLVVVGQRRLDQNGADAAALAVGKLLAGSASSDQNGNVAFSVPDETIYGLARYYAGLSQTDWTSGTSANPTGVNQNPGLVTRNRLAVTLEYWGTVDFNPPQWCYSPTGPVPVRQRGGQSPVEPACVMQIDGTTVRPPLPADGIPFKVRVTVSSTANGYFSRVIGLGDGAPAPPDLTDNGTPACVGPQTGAKSGTTWTWSPLPWPGRTMCAQAVISIRGSDAPPGNANPIPVGSSNCDVEATPFTVGGGVVFLHQLWGSTGTTCATDPNGSSFGNLYDFSAAASATYGWCSEAGGGSVPDPDYKYYRLLPGLTSPSTYVRAQCVSTGDGSQVDTWQRDNENGRYKADPNFAGHTDPTIDIPYWVAKGFRGTIKVDTNCDFAGSPAVWTCTGGSIATGDGAKIPTYSSTNPSSGGVLGQNVAIAFYCDNTVTNTTCPGNTITIDAATPSGTYFFAKNQPGFQNVCDDEFKAFNTGCRDVAVILWTYPEWANGLNNGGDSWQTTKVGGGGADRIRAARVLNFRIYCDHATPGDINTPCSSPPKSVVGSAANSDVWGRFVSLALAGSCSTSCAQGVTLNGNYANLES